MHLIKFLFFYCNFSIETENNILDWDNHFPNQNVSFPISDSLRNIRKSAVRFLFIHKTLMFSQHTF